jgi:hypothetical protein
VTPNWWGKPFRRKVLRQRNKPIGPMSFFIVHGLSHEPLKGKGRET